MTNLLFVPNPLLRQKAEKIRSVGPDEKKIANDLNFYLSCEFLSFLANKFC